MFLAIVTKITAGEPNKRQTAQAIPIRTGELAAEILGRMRFPFIMSRWEAQKRLREALDKLETDTKNRTILLGLEHS